MATLGAELSQVSVGSLKSPSNVSGDGEAIDQNATEENADVAGADGLAEQLAAISIQVDDAEEQEPEPETTDPVSFPIEYTKNSDKEIKCLDFVDTFNNQFKHLYSHRRPLFLTALNECGVEKFVSTTIRPTKLPYEELYHFQGAAAFVADFLHYEFLPDPTTMPTVLPSPTTIMWRQKANCFEFAAVLCSLLEGVGYDAYCVNGYATKEVCLLEQNRLEALLEKPKPEVKKEEAPAKKNKYFIAPPKKLESSFTEKQAAKRKAREEEAAKKAADVKEKKRLESLKPKPEPLMGLRVHCWVMVRAGKRGVPETFFIEPTTGHALSILDENYVGLETVWNSKNLWVNMQKCHNGLVDMRYDLADTSLWEFVFPEDTNTSIKLDGVDAPEDTGSKVDIPPSWVRKLSLQSQDYETRCPNGKKVILLEQSKTEVFSPYLREDGLVRRTTEYAEEEMKTPLSTLDVFENRKDRLLKRFEDLKTRRVEEYFLPGHKHNIRKHTFTPSDSGPGTRDMEFYSRARADGLIRRLDTGVEMIETFEDRPDFLIERQTVFPGGKLLIEKTSTVPAVITTSDVDSNRKVVNARETRLRNETVEADSDPETVTYSEDRISVVYHMAASRVTKTTRDFEKPKSTDSRAFKPLSQDMVDCYEADPTKPALRLFELQKVFQDLQKLEEKCNKAISASVDETDAMVALFAEQNAHVELSISFYDTTRNKDAELRRQKMEQEEKEAQQRREEMLRDYMAPFLMQLTEPEVMTTEKANWLREACLRDLKERLVEKARLIQEWYQREQRQLKEKQSWYQENQSKLKPEEEDEYIKFCSDALFRIKMLEQRLEYHKEQAPTKYVQLDSTIQNDPRFAPYLTD